jgi:hypothetical protein
MAQMTLANGLERLKAFLGNCLPSAGRVNSFTDTAVFHTLDEFINIYYDPISVNLESSRSWPIHSPVL